MTDTAPEKLRIVAYKDGETWIAQCVEYDICTQASDLVSLQKRMTALIEAEAEFTNSECGAPFATIPPAPDYFEAMFIEADGSSLQSEQDFRIAA